MKCNLLILLILFSIFSCAKEKPPHRIKHGHHPRITLEPGWDTKFIPYLRLSGFLLTPAEESLDALEKIYKRYLRRDFLLDSLVELHEYHQIDDGKLGDVGRATKIACDRALLQKIDQALDQYNWVFVVLGGSHRISSRAIVAADHKLKSSVVECATIADQDSLRSTPRYKR